GVGESDAGDLLRGQRGRVGADLDDGVQPRGPYLGVLGGIDQQRLPLQRTFQRERGAARDVCLYPDPAVQPVEGVGRLLVPVVDRDVELTAIGESSGVLAHFRAAVPDSAHRGNRGAGGAQRGREVGGGGPAGDGAERVPKT